MVNRHAQRAQELAKQYGFKSCQWDELPSVLNKVDNIFVATASPHFILKPEDFYSVPRPKFIVDISVPRNVDPTVGQFNGISLFNTDNLEGYSGYSGENQQKLVEQAKTIIQREEESLMLWHQTRRIAPLIAQIRAHYDDIRQDEVAHVLSKNPDLAEAGSVIESVSRMLLNRLLHQPTVMLKSKAQAAQILDPVAEFERLLVKSLMGHDLIQDELDALKQDQVQPVSSTQVQLFETKRGQNVVPLKVG